jgi:hypothetical protein
MRLLPRRNLEIAVPTGNSVLLANFELTLMLLYHGLPDIHLYPHADLPAWIGSGIHLIRLRRAGRW